LIQGTGGLAACGPPMPPTRSDDISLLSVITCDSQ
jgi:hypothetical protein